MGVLNGQSFPPSTTHVAPLGLWGVVITAFYKHVAPLGLMKHNTYRRR